MPNGNLIPFDLSKKAWKGFPVRFADMCRSIFSGDGKYTERDALIFLQSVHMDDACNAKKGQLRFLSWVDRFFGDCMYPMEFKQSVWENEKTLITEVLEKAYNAAMKLDPDIYQNGHRVKEAVNNENEVTVMLQDLDVYLFTCFVCSKRIKMSEIVLERICEATKRNLLQLIKYENAESLITFPEEKEAFYFKGEEYWQEPLAWIFHESLMGKWAWVMVKKYKDYWDFLKTLETECSRTGLIQKLLRQEEERLLCLCDYATEEYEVKIEMVQAQIEEYQSEIEKICAIEREQAGQISLP